MHISSLSVLLWMSPFSLYHCCKTVPVKLCGASTDNLETGVTNNRIVEIIYSGSSNPKMDISWNMKSCRPALLPLMNNEADLVVLEIIRQSGIDLPLAHLMSKVSISLIPSDKSLPVKLLKWNSTTITILNTRGYSALSITILENELSASSAQLVQREDYLKFYIRVFLLTKDTCNTASKIICDSGRCHVARRVRSVCSGFDQSCLKMIITKLASSFRSEVELFHFVELALNNENVRKFQTDLDNGILLGLSVLNGKLVYPRTMSTEDGPTNWLPVEGIERIRVIPCSTNDREYVSLRKAINKEPVLELINASEATQLNVLLSPPIVLASGSSICEANMWMLLSSLIGGLLACNQMFFCFMHLIGMHSAVMT